MEKNWVIRTIEKKILGPTTRQKVLELLEKGSLREEDEICSGNGYWFFARERELVEKYLIQGTAQSFNPISEAKNVVVVAAGSHETTKVQKLRKPEGPKGQKDEACAAAFPEDADLEYPVIEGTVVRVITPVKSEVPVLEAKQSDGPREPVRDESGVFYPDKSDLEFPDLPSSKKVKNRVSLPDQQKIRSYKSKKSKRGEREMNVQRNDRFLFYIFIFAILLILAGVFYSLQNKFLNLSSFSPISSVYAQDVSESLSKKKI